MDDPSVAHLARCVAPSAAWALAVGYDEILGVPVAQRRGAHAESGGELGDAHRVRRAYVRDRLTGDGPRRLLRAPELGALGVQLGVRGIKAREHLGDEAAMHGPDDLLRPARSDPHGQCAVGQRGVEVGLAVGAVARGRARRRRQHAVALEIAHQLHRARRSPGHISGTQFETWHAGSLQLLTRSLHKHLMPRLST